MIPEIQKKQKELEGFYIACTPAVDATATDLYNKDKDLALAYLTNYSDNAGNHTVAEWKNLYHYLFTKYMDGNIKVKVPGQQNPSVEQPGYSKEWYRMIVKETGDKFRVPEEENEK